MASLPHGTVDWIVAIYLFFGIVAGFRRGFVASAFAILTAAAAIGLGIAFASPVLAWADRSWHVVSRGASAIAGYTPLPDALAQQPLSQESLTALLQWVNTLPWPEALQGRVDQGIRNAAVAAMSGNGTTIGDFAYHLASSAALEIIAFTAVYLVAAGVLRLIVGALARSVARPAWLGSLNRVAGGALGLATSGITAAIMLSAVMGISILLPHSWAATVDSSSWAAFLVNLLDRVMHTALQTYAT